VIAAATPPAYRSGSGTAANWPQRLSVFYALEWYAEKDFYALLRLHKHFIKKQDGLQAFPQKNLQIRTVAIGYVAYHGQPISQINM